MTVRDPLFVVGTSGVGQTSPTEARLALAGLIAPGSGGVSARTGVLYGPSTPLAVSGTSGMSYSVAAGTAVTARSSAALGVYVGANDAAATVSTGAAPGGAGTSRWDLIYIKFPDAEQGDANSAGVLGVQQGTAAGSPTKPYGSVPQGALVLAEAQIAQGVTRTDTGVTITQVSQWTVASGATVPVRSQAERDAIAAYPGLCVYRTDTARTEQWTGGAWAVVLDPNAWASYTPAWTAATTNPALGNGTLTGRWTQVGNIVHYRIRLVAGSTTTYGSGAYRLSLPVTMAQYLSGAAWPIGQGVLYDVSATNTYVRNGIAGSASFLALCDDSGNTVNATTPVTLASGDTLAVQGCYEAA